jgi:hypothetical protein
MNLSMAFALGFIEFASNSGFKAQREHLVSFFGWPVAWMKAIPRAGVSQYPIWRLQIVEFFDQKMPAGRRV